MSDKKREYARLSKVSAESLRDFAELDHDVQLQVIASILSPSKNRKVPAADRRLAERRAAQFQAVADGEKPWEY
jgi:hypothetical protein